MKQKKRKKLVFQIVFAVSLLLILLNTFVFALMYQSMVSGFLEAQNETTEEYLDHLLNVYQSPYEDPNVLELCISYWEENPQSIARTLSDEERDELIGLLYSESPYESGSYEWFQHLSEKGKQYYFYGNHEYWFETEMNQKMEQTDSYSHMFVMDATEPYAGMILGECSKDGESHVIGEYYDKQILQTKEIRQIMNSNSKDTVFFRAKDFPANGYYYLGCKPIYVNGKLRAILGIAYKWSPIRTNLMQNMWISMIISLIGILLILLIMTFIIYRKAIKPVSDIETALKTYSEEKNSAKIVKSMYEIQPDNEIGYLTDVISDFVLEVDYSAKENIRIATEQERAEKELYEAKVQIMVSQIRPHFMYNALTSIAMMCEIDPKTAKEATITFAKYLRCNMDALKQTAPVPFEQELEHLKKYLYIEKLRFDDLLNIEYDIQTTEFEVPLLSIQPIVENAVKHGVGMAEDGGTVKIATRETETAYEIIVSDDGVGFDTSAPKKEDGRSHVGMENTKKRLKDLCNADIVIESTVGKGTTVTVTIPKKELNEHENPVS
jgi:sensor histidine kinase YesM